MKGIYFSGTGNTRHCVRRFVTESDDSAEVYAIEDEQSLTAVEELQESEILVFGYSVQYSNLPKMVRDYVADHAALWSGKKIYIIATMGMFSGDGAGMLGRLLTKYGAEIVGGLHLRMPDSICDEKALKHTAEVDLRTIEQSEEKIGRAVQQLRAGKPTREGLGFFYHMAGLFGQRLYFYNKTRNYSDKLTIHVDRCVGCGLCASLCPMDNITIRETAETDKELYTVKVAVPHGKCTMCYRCINQCPQQAITLLGKRVVKQTHID